jgi:hypothetical protein
VALPSEGRTAAPLHGGLMAALPIVRLDTDMAVRIALDTQQGPSQGLRLLGRLLGLRSVRQRPDRTRIIHPRLTTIRRSGSYRGPTSVDRAAAIDSHPRGRANTRLADPDAAINTNTGCVSTHAVPRRHGGLGRATHPFGTPTSVQ